MCIVFIDFNPSPIDSTKRYKLVIASNRDEFYDRPTIPARFWTDPGKEHIIAGKDILSEGTWIGVSKKGRIGILTFYRAQFKSPATGKNRGLLVLDYLSELSHTPTQYSAQVIDDPSEYDGFNLIVGNISKDNHELVYCSNRGDKGVCPLVGGVYGLSNASLDTPWSKVKEGKKKFQEILSETPHIEQEELIEKLMTLLNDDTCYYPDSEVHETGHPEHWKKGSCSIFTRIHGEKFGTRCNTVILVDEEGVVTYVERTMKEPIIEGSFTWSTTTEIFKIHA